MRFFNVAAIPLSQLPKLLTFYNHLIPSPHSDFFNCFKNVFSFCLFNKRLKQGPGSSLYLVVMPVKSLLIYNRSSSLFYDMCLEETNSFVLWSFPYFGFGWLFPCHIK